MLDKKISVSCILAIALAFTGCGGGGDTTPSDIGETGTITDKSAPVFAADAVTSKTVEEGTGGIVATYTVTDENPVTFSLEGADADDFLLTAETRALEYKATLKFKTAPDYEQKESYHVTLVATDKDGNSASKDITVNITDKPFSFNVAGAMTPVVAGQTGELALVVEEAKSDVSYSVQGAHFTLNGNKVVFVAPAYVEGGNNNYFGLVRATDGDSTIELTVKASVIKDANAKPDIKTYLLTSQRDVDTLGAWTLYEYTYDANHYLVNMKKSGTNVGASETTSFEYSDGHKIMKGYKEPGHKLKSIRVFEAKNTEKHKFAADIQLRLSLDDYTNYMSYIQDTVTLKDNVHLTKYIHGLEFNQKRVELYAYNANDQLSRVLTGSYTIDSDLIKTMTDAQLHTENAPAGGYPAGNTRLSTAQLSSLNSGAMPVSISHETT